MTQSPFADDTKGDLVSLVQENVGASSISPLSAKGVEQKLHSYSDGLLDRSRSQWQFGDWTSLSKLDSDLLQHNSERAKLAVLAAAGLLQIGKIKEARKFIQLAQKWGCTKNYIKQILISGVYNTLGRASFLLEQDERNSSYFKQAITIGAPHDDQKLLSLARANHQYADLKICLQHIKARTALSKISTIEVKQHHKVTTAADSHHLNFYKNLDTQNQDGETTTPFLLLDSKSLPRSGLHYLKNTLAQLLGEHFSFCEWYQEPGCCKTMPCALTGYAQYAKEKKSFRLRLIKSHDFELIDPILAPCQHVRQLVLVRDPLFILTSWFVLNQLDKHSMELKKKGIHMDKLYLSHEKEVLLSAYQLIDKVFQEPNIDDITTWLTAKSEYMVNFLKKWINYKENPLIYIVQYEQINNLITEITNKYYKILSESSKNNVNSFKQQASNQFRRRTDPFTAPTQRLTEYLQKHSTLFEEAANYIKYSSPSYESNFHMAERTRYNRE